MRQLRVTHLVHMEVVILLEAWVRKSPLLTIVCKPEIDDIQSKTLVLMMGMIPGMCRYVAQNAQIIVIQIDFRLGPEHPTPAQVEDCTSAYKWVSPSTLWSCG